MNPKPFASLNHLTLPVVRIPAPERTWDDAGRRRPLEETLGGTVPPRGNAVREYSRAFFRSMVDYGVPIGAGDGAIVLTPVTKYGVSPKQLVGIPRCSSYVSVTRFPSEFVRRWAMLSLRTVKYQRSWAWPG